MRYTPTSLRPRAIIWGGSEAQKSALGARNGAEAHAKDATLPFTATAIG
jgi:hypothetical protein